MGRFESDSINNGIIVSVVTLQMQSHLRNIGIGTVALSFTESRKMLNWQRLLRCKYLVQLPVQRTKIYFYVTYE